MSLYPDYIECSPPSLHDALPISSVGTPRSPKAEMMSRDCCRRVSPSAASSTWAVLSDPVMITTESGAPLVTASWPVVDRKSTRLNSSHVKISYVVFCLKKKKIEK